MRIRRFILFLIPLYLLSCKPQQHLAYYLEHGTDTTRAGNVKAQDLKIQKNDLLSIQIHSLSTKPEESDAIYNQITTTSFNTGVNPVNTTGYLVDAEGNIEHHRLGTFHVEGMTKQELAAEIKKRLTQPVELLKNPTVIIRFLNYHVTVNGEVAKPGAIYVPGERINILEAIGLAGDFKEWGMKNNVKVIREINGQREIGTIDLSDQDKLFNSPYYELMQNDVVIVQPSPKKSKVEEQTLLAQKVSIALSVATVALAITNIFIGSGR